MCNRTVTRSDEVCGSNRDAIAALAARRASRVANRSGYGPAGAATPRLPMLGTAPRRPRRTSTGRPSAPRRPPRATRPRRNPAAGLPLLVLLMMLAAFFAWVSAEPAWLAAGRGDQGTVTVSACSGSGIRQRCIGTFTTTAGYAARGYTVHAVAVTGTGASRRHPGATLPARMVGPDARTAYAGDLSGLHFRWALGLILVTCCGLAMIAATGAWRLRGRARRGAIATSLGLPLLLAAAMLAATW